MKLNGRKKDTVEQNNTEIILSDQELRKLQLDLLEMLIGFEFDSARRTSGNGLY